MFRPRRAAALRILDFDTECRPLHYSEWRKEDQVTGIAWSWVGEDYVHCQLLDRELTNEVNMLGLFLEAFNQADIVTGHYIRKHDLPLLADQCIRLGFPVLKPVMTQDTQADMVKVKGLGKSQQNLAETFNLTAEKHTMSGAAWRQANTLTPEGQAGTRQRVVSDVLQHKQLRAELLERKLLKAPKLWRP